MSYNPELLRIANSKENYPQGLYPEEILKLVQWVYIINNRTIATMEDVEMIAPGRNEDLAHIAKECPDQSKNYTVRLDLFNELLDVIDSLGDYNTFSDYVLEIDFTGHYWVLTKRPVECLTKLDLECMAILNDNSWWSIS